MEAQGLEHICFRATREAFPAIKDQIKPEK
jgi:hypothetical protein